MNSCFAAQPKSVGEIYRAAMPGTLQLGTYGMTEASGIVSTGHYGMDPEMGYTRLGVPLLGVEVRIADPEKNTDIPLGERGEICLRGYSVLSGYYRDAQKNAQCFDAEGWFHTGDIGSLDESGHLMFHTRLKDMLKVGGENVAAAEIEAQLTKHPAVKLAQVVGYPGPEVHGGSGRIRRALSRQTGRRGGAHRTMPRRNGVLQGAASGALRHRVADVRVEDPEIPIA